MVKSVWIHVLQSKYLGFVLEVLGTDRVQCCREIAFVIKSNALHEDLFVFAIMYGKEKERFGIRTSQIKKIGSLLSIRRRKYQILRLELCFMMKGMDEGFKVE